MKNIFVIIGFMFILYIFSIFIFPVQQNKISNSLRLGEFDTFVVEKKQEIETFFQENVLTYFTRVKDSTLEIKQNIETQVDQVTTGVKEIGNAIDDVRTNIDNTQKSINDTINSVNKVKDSFGNIIPNEVPKDEIQNQETVEEKIQRLKKELDELKTQN